MNQLTYAELAEQIEKAPMSYLPALLVTVCNTAQEKRCFVPGGMTAIVRKLETAKCGVIGADEDECDFEHCPQLRDGEPEATGRSCPLFK